MDESIYGYVGTRDIIDKVVDMGYTCQVESINGVMMSGDGGKGMGGGGGGRDDATSGYFPLTTIINRLTSTTITSTSTTPIINMNRRSHYNELDSWYMPLIISLVFGIPVLIISITMNISTIVMIAMTTPTMQVLLLSLNIPIILFTGYRYYKAAWVSAKYYSYGMDALIAVGTTLSLCLSCFMLVQAFNTNADSNSSSDGNHKNNHNFYVTSGMLLMFVTVGKYIEGKILAIINDNIMPLSPLPSSLSPLLSSSSHHHHYHHHQYFTAYAKVRSYTAVSNLLKLQPREASLVIHADGVLMEAMKTSNQLSKYSANWSRLTSNGIINSTTIELPSSLSSLTSEEIKMIDLDLVQKGDVLKVVIVCSATTTYIITTFTSSSILLPSPS